MSKTPRTTKRRGTVKAATAGGHPGAGIVAELRTAIARAERAGQSRYQTAKRAGIAPIVLARFADSERGLNLETAAKIAEAVDLRLTLLTKRLSSRVVR